MFYFLTIIRHSYTFNKYLYYIKTNIYIIKVFCMYKLYIYIYLSKKYFKILIQKYKKMLIKIMKIKKFLLYERRKIVDFFNLVILI